MRRIFLFICWFCLLCSALSAQNGEPNPFEIQGETPAIVEEAVERPPVKRSDNPFDIAPAPEVEDIPTAQPEGPLLIRRDSNPDVLDAKGRTLGIHILLLVFMALCWIFFRPLLAKIYRSILNDGIFNQLYRERKSGKLGLYIAVYLLFFAAASFFIYLVGQAFERLPSDRPWQYWQYFLIGIAGYYVTKHLVLYALGWLFPKTQEVCSKYSFLIMLFGVIMGTILIPANLMISYAPASITIFVAYFSLFILFLLYLLRAGRSLLLVNGFMPQGVLHFLLYICAIEIAPLLIIYRLFVG